MKTLASHILDTAKIVILAVLLVLGVQYVYAWTGPTLPPTGGNPDPPVNVSNNPQVKNGDLGVNSFTADNTQINGTLNVIGASTLRDITASAGIFSSAVSGASLTATAGGAITGGSLNVGTGAITGGQGTFSGGVKAGNRANGGTDGITGVEYLELDFIRDTSCTSGGGPPDGTECDATSESGRVVFDNCTGVPYICIQGRGSPEDGWKEINVKYK